MKKIVLFFRMVWTLPTITTRHHSKVRRYRYLLDAMRKVETGGTLHPNYAVGDDGRSIGPYQITYDYWLDAARETLQLREGTWSMCVIPSYAEKVILSYWKKYASAEASWEHLARIHNGGPNGYKKQETAKYWQKVSKHLFN